MDFCCFVTSKRVAIKKKGFPYWVIYVSNKIVSFIRYHIVDRETEIDMEKKGGMERKCYMKREGQIEMIGDIERDLGKGAGLI